MVTSHRLLFVILLLGCLGSAPAAPLPEPDSGAAPSKSDQPPLTLEAALDTAVRCNPSLQRRQLEVQAASGRALTAAQWSNPEFEVSAEDVPVDREGLHSGKRLVGVAQTVPFPGKKKHERRTAAAEVRSSQAAYDWQRIQLAREVKVAFYRVLLGGRLVATAEELVNTATASATAARKRVEAGAIPLQEQLRAEIRSEQAASERDEFRRELALARATLALLLGRPELQNAVLAETLPGAMDRSDLDRGPDHWLPQHPARLVAVAERDRAESELRRARSGIYPDVRLGVAGGRDDAADASVMELRLAVPLPLFDRQQGRRREAEAQLSQAALGVTAEEQRLVREWRDARLRFATADDQVKSYVERMLPRADDALRLVKTGFDEGKFGFIDLLDTQRTAGEVRLAYQKKLLERCVAQADLESFLKSDAAPLAQTSIPAVKP